VAGDDGRGAGLDDLGLGVRGGVGDVDRQAEPVKGAQHVRVAFMVEAGLHPEHDCEPPAGGDRADIGAGEREGHAVAVPLEVAQGGLDQAQRLLRGAVEVPVAVGRDVLDDDVDPAGGGAGEVEPERLWLPGVDALPVHPVGDVLVAVDDDGQRACAHWTCLAWTAGTRPGRTPAP
jgi:hypothetical protein